MKKFFVALCLIAFCTVSFVGCNPPKQTPGDEATPTSSAPADTPAADAPADAPAE